MNQSLVDIYLLLDSIAQLHTKKKEVGSFRILFESSIGKRSTWAYRPTPVAGVNFFASSPSSVVELMVLGED